MRRTLSEHSPEDRTPPRPAQRNRARPDRRLWLAWAWVVLWAGVIWMLGGEAFSLADTSRTMAPWLEWLFGDLTPQTKYRIFLAVRKSAHFLEYAVLALLTFRAALRSAGRNQLATAAWVALFLVAGLASADEARQALSATRTGSAGDVAIDLAGGLIAVAALLAISRRMRPAARAGSSV